MLVDICLKLPWVTKESQGKDTLSPVAAIKDFPLEDQIEMWLLRSGLVQIEMLTEDSASKFKFFVNGSELNSLKDIEQGATVEVRSLDCKEESKQEQTSIIKQKKPTNISSLMKGSFYSSSS